MRSMVEESDHKGEPNALLGAGLVVHHQSDRNRIVCEDVEEFVVTMPDGVSVKAIAMEGSLLPA